MKKCPYCAEEIQDEAIKCRYCLSDLTRVKTANESESKQDTSKEAILREVEGDLVVYPRVTKDKNGRWKQTHPSSEQVEVSKIAMETAGSSQQQSKSTSQVECNKPKIIQMNYSKRSTRWSLIIFVMVVVMALVKLLFAFAYKDVGGHIAMALMTLLGGIIILVVPAYFIGMLVDKSKGAAKSNIPEQEDSSVKQNNTGKVSETTSPAVYVVGAIVVLAILTIVIVTIFNNSDSSTNSRTSTSESRTADTLTAPPAPPAGAEPSSATQNAGVNPFDKYVDPYRNEDGTLTQLGREQEARDKEQRNKYEASLRKWDNAIRLNPYDGDAYFERGTAFFSLNQSQRGMQDYDEAIRLKPDAEKYYTRGWLYCWGSEQYQRAIEDFNEAIRIDPKHAGAYINRSYAYGKLGNNAYRCRDAIKACELGSCETLEKDKQDGYCR